MSFERTAGWTVQRSRLPAAEAPDGALPLHHLCIQLDGPSWREDRDDGRWRHRQLDPGDVTLRPAGVPSRAAWTQPIDVLTITVDPVTFGMATGDRQLAQRIHTGPDPVTGNLAKALMATDNLEVADAITTAMGAHLVAHYGQPSTDHIASPRVRPLTTTEFGRVREYISATFAEPILNDDLAALVAVSPDHFSRAFREASGLTPHAYIMERRVEEAVGSLIRTELPVNDVARRNGFADGGHLARHTRRRYNLSPLELRALRRRKLSTRANPVPPPSIEN